MNIASSYFLLTYIFFIDIVVTNYSARISLNGSVREKKFFSARARDVYFFFTFAFSKTLAPDSWQISCRQVTPVLQAC